MKAVGDLIFKYLKQIFLCLSGNGDTCIFASYFESYLETYQVWHAAGKAAIKEL